MQTKFEEDFLFHKRRALSLEDTGQQPEITINIISRSKSAKNS